MFKNLYIYTCMYVINNLSEIISNYTFYFNYGHGIHTRIDIFFKEEEEEVDPY
jgi:hypothetical protein